MVEFLACVICDRQREVFRAYYSAIYTRSYPIGTIGTAEVMWVPISVWRPIKKVETGCCNLFCGIEPTCRLHAFSSYWENIYMSADIPVKIFTRKIIHKEFAWWRGAAHNAGLLDLPTVAS